MWKSGLRKYSAAASSTASAGNSTSISSTLLLTRNPVITADVSKFEAQYYKYQNELWKRLMWTFPSWFYYRKGTISEQAFRELNPGPVFNNPNIEFPRGRPVVVHQRDRRFKQELKLPKTYKEVSQEKKEGGETAAEEEGAKEDNLSRQIVPNSRITKADESKDLASLERQLSRTLYLIIQENSKWTLPTFKEEQVAQGDDTKDSSVTPLHTLAEQGLYKIGGNSINYFNVSNTPCHVHKSESTREYFIKSHILSGRFVPQSESIKFLWLTKEELGEYLEKDYYKEIEHLLSDI
ncbi:54S ribosomal protein L17, mitochondrial [[Candida] railenensis]|uniref:Large ribosomal subunit protein mL46 n=1 Tax=[Candida] railenensis TaxID=45579 RepID=A0A9P0QM21_9ASCO|nr:54S ribosomal protein L17, mitochondrial [[Candida] railenensis]